MRQFRSLRSFDSSEPGMCRPSGSGIGNSVTIKALKNSHTPGAINDHKEDGFKAGRNRGKIGKIGVKATLYTLLECSGARSCNHKFHKTGEVSSTKIMMGRCRDGEMGRHKGR